MPKSLKARCSSSLRPALGRGPSAPLVDSHERRKKVARFAERFPPKARLGSLFALSVRRALHVDLEGKSGSGTQFLL